MSMERPSEIGELLATLRGENRLTACVVCRYWRQNRDDERTPQWGTCLRMSVQPFPGMVAVSEDPELGAMLITHPKHYCSEFEE